MKNIRNVSFALMVISSGCCLKGTSNNKYIDNNRQVVWYHRESGGINDYFTYYDYFVIKNYDQLTIKEFSNIAQSYIDTVQADLPVSSVTFIAANSFDCLPAYEDSYIHSDKGLKAHLIRIGFDNSLPTKRGNKKVKVDRFTLYYNGNFTYYTSNTMEEKKVFDSLFNINRSLIDVLDDLVQPK